MVTKTRVLATCLMMAIAPCAVRAQLVDPGSADQIVGLFLEKAAGDDFRGGVVSRGDQRLSTDARWKFAWQADYGSLTVNRVTPTGTTPSQEADVSKNSGIYTVSYIRRFGALWRLTADGGVEHRSLRDTDDTRREQIGGLVNVSARNIGARLLGGDPDRAPELAWSLQANFTSSEAILRASEDRKLFLDPAAVIWLSVWMVHIQRDEQQPPRLFPRFQIRAEGAGIQPFGGGADAEGHWDAALLFFFTPENALMLRRFSGFFDHNLRDRKNATTLNLLWKFR